MKKIVVAIPHSHTWLWTQTCVASLVRNPPRADGYKVEVVVVDNSPWSPAIRGLTQTDLMLSATKAGINIRTLNNYKSNRFHASALDCVVEKFEFDLLMALETDVLALRPDWLQWFVDQLRSDDYAVGMWHHEQFVNPSCTLYRSEPLRIMGQWCKSPLGAPQNELRWGQDFSKTAPLDNSLTPGVLSDPRDLEAAIKGFQEWVAGPFAEKRGFRPGTTMAEQPSGQLKGPGWYEPGQQLHHLATNMAYTYTVCQSMTTNRPGDNMPLQTLYGTDMPDPQRQLSATEMFGNARTAHLWGGTRALDILKHDVTCGFVKANTPYWLAREARFWCEVVPPDIQAQTIELIRREGFHITGQGNAVRGGDERDRAAAEYVRACYREGGVEV